MYVHVQLKYVQERTLHPCPQNWFSLRQMCWLVQPTLQNTKCTTHQPQHAQGGKSILEFRNLNSFTSKHPSGTHAAAENPAAPKHATPQSRFSALCARALHSLSRTNPFQMPGGFYATFRCRLRHYTKLPWREIKTKDTLEPKMGCRPS